MTSEPIEGEFVEEHGTQAVAIRDERAGAIEAPSFSREQLDVLKSTLATDLTDTEFELFIHVSRRTGLDPFARQIFAIKRGGKMTIQTSIDGFRLQAQRSGKLRGFRGPLWCGSDGQWREVWLEEFPPEAAKVEVVHADYETPVAGVARWGAFVQTDRDGSVTPMWRRMGDHMLAKCAEALALRRAFPAELSGIYTDDEMGQADGGSNATAAALPAGGATVQDTPRREPTPPQPRPAPPRAGVPPATAPAAQQAQSGARKPDWAEPLKAALESRGIGLDEVASFLGATATNANITAWLEGEEGRTPAMLAEDAASLAKTEAAVATGDISPDDSPF